MVLRDVRHHHVVLILRKDLVKLLEDNAVSKLYTSRLDQGLEYSLLTLEILFFKLDKILKQLSWLRSRLSYHAKISMVVLHARSKLLPLRLVRKLYSGILLIKQCAELLAVDAFLPTFLSLACDLFSPLCTLHVFDECGELV